MTLIARYSGYCPLCSKFISKNRSTIERINPPIEPRTWDGITSADDRKLYNSNGTEIMPGLRKFGHAKCVAQWVAAGKPDMPEPTPSMRYEIERSSRRPSGYGKDDNEVYAVMHDAATEVSS